MNTKILDIIKKFRDHYGVNGLSNGNCGTFSLALYEILKKINVDCKLAFTYEETKPESTTIEQVIGNEADIHHVFIQIETQFYDCTGAIDGEYLVKFSEREYGVTLSGIGYFENIDPVKEEAVVDLINWETNWNISTNDFIEFYEKEKNSELKEFNIKQKGSCMLYAEKVNNALIAKNIKDYSVIEGYVRFKKENILSPTFQHTWIEFKDGRIIDKTKAQFQGYDLSTIQYIKKNAKIYSPEEYKKLCQSHPVDMNGQSLKEDYPVGWNKQEFEKISSYAKKLKYANSHLTKLASGSGRVVYIIDDTKVLKMAKNKKGVAQNKVEVDWGAQDMYGEIITKHYDHSDNFYWVEMDRAERISPKKFEQLVGVKFEDFCDYLDSRSNEPRRKKLDSELMVKIEEKEFPERVAAFMLDFDKGVGDLKRISSYGKVVRDGIEKIVIVDFGLSKQVFDDFYKVGPKKHNYY